MHDYSIFLLKCQDFCVNLQFKRHITSGGATR
jgi:hypothetical protein